MNDQNQNRPAPDYGFILNQQPNDNKPEPHKKDKKLIIIGVLLAVLALTVVVGSLLSAKNKVATVNESDDIGLAYLKNISDNNAQAAYSLLSSDTKSKLTVEEFAKNTLPRLNENIDLAKCTAGETADTVHSYACPTKNKEYNVTIYVELVSGDNSSSTIDKATVAKVLKLSHNKLKRISHLFALSAIVVGVWMSGGVAYAAPAGCYGVAPEGLQKVDCQIFVAMQPRWQYVENGLCHVAPENVDGTYGFPVTQDCASLGNTYTESTDTLEAAKTRQQTAGDQQLNNTRLQSGTITNDCQSNGDNCETYGYLTTIINILSALVGIIVVIMIIVGGIQYSSASGDPQRVSAAKQRIYNAVLALLAFLFLFAFLQWIVPGGAL